jgi:hypothetical protein
MAIRMRAQTCLMCARVRSPPAGSSLKRLGWSRSSPSSGITYLTQTMRRRQGQGRDRGKGTYPSNAFFAQQRVLCPATRSLPSNAFFAQQRVLCPATRSLPSNAFFAQQRVLCRVLCPATRNAFFVQQRVLPRNALFRRNALL